MFSSFCACYFFFFFFCFIELVLCSIVFSLSSVVLCYVWVKDDCMEW